MTARRILLLLLPLSLLLVALAVPQPTQQGGGSRQGFDTPLGRHMVDLERTLKGIDATLKAKEGLAAKLPDVCRIQKILVDAKTETPKMIAEMEQGKKRDKALLEFRLELQNVLRALLDLEAALLKDDVKKAKKALREMAKLESAGHSKFRPMGGR